MLIPEKGFYFKLYQRDQIEIPSSKGSVVCFIDDITKGQTLITIRYEDEILMSKSIHQNEEIVFDFGKKQYQIACKQLENLLIGNDYGCFIIQSIPNITDVNSEIGKIEELLARIESADLIFIRNGKEYSSRDAAQHIRTKWKRAPEIVTLNDFIEKIASHSSTTGEPYQVKMKNGTIITAIEWYDYKVFE